MKRFGWWTMTLLSVGVALYAIAVLFVPGFGAPIVGRMRAATPLATTSDQGIVTHLGFGALAVAWLFCTIRGYLAIRGGDDVVHRAWMMRSFALTFAAVMLRIILPLELAFGIPFPVAYKIVSWACWVPNLLVAEWCVRAGRPAARPSIAGIAIVAVLTSMGLSTVVRAQPANAVDVHFTTGASARSIPFERVNDKILLRVGVNGSPAATFILDTGANVDVVSLRFARTAGMPLEPWTGGSVGIGNRPPELHTVTDPLAFTLPGLAVSDSRVFAIALDNIDECLARAGQGQPAHMPVIDGVLGAPFFRSLIVEIDYAARQLHLYDPSHYRYKGHGRSLPIDLDASYTYVEAQVALPRGRPARAKLVVDTGAGVLSLTKQFAAAHGVLPPANALTPGAECGSAGLSNVPTLVGAVDRLQLGPFTLRNAVTTFYEATADRTYDGLLGADALQHFRVIFDYSRRRMILEPAGKR
jgi:Predicted membrane protein (DUF2306)/Aspartyl protease